MLMSTFDKVIQTKEEEQTQDKRIRIIHSYRVNKDRPTLIVSIPQDIRKLYNLNKRCSLYLIPKKDCFCLKKVDLEGIE